MRREINKYGSFAENHPAVENMQWALGERGFLLFFWGLILKQKDIWRFWRLSFSLNSMKKFKELGRNFKLGWFLKTAILNNWCKLLHFFHIFPKLFLNIILRLLGQIASPWRSQLQDKRWLVSVLATITSGDQEGFIQNENIIWVSQKLFEARYLKE